MSDKPIYGQSMLHSFYGPWSRGSSLTCEEREVAEAMRLHRIEEVRTRPTPSGVTEIGPDKDGKFIMLDMTAAGDVFELDRQRELCRLYGMPLDWLAENDPHIRAAVMEVRHQRAKR